MERRPVRELFICQRHPPALIKRPDVRVQLTPEAIDALSEGLKNAADWLAIANGDVVVEVDDETLIIISFVF